MKLHVNRGFKLKVGLDEIGSGCFFRSPSEKLNQTAANFDDFSFFVKSEKWHKKEV